MTTPRRLLESGDHLLIEDGTSFRLLEETFAPITAYIFGGLAVGRDPSIVLGTDPGVVAGRDPRIVQGRDQ